MVNRPGRILVVDDLARWRGILSELLTGDGYTVDVAATIAEVFARLSETFYHLIVLDVRMNEDDDSNEEGMELLPELLKIGLGDALHVIMLSAHSTKEHLRLAFRDYNVDDFWTKEEFDDQEALAEVRQLFAEKFRINLRLAIHWQQVTGSEQIVVGLEYAGTRIRRAAAGPIAQAAAELDDLLCRLFYKADTLLVGPLTSGHSGAAVLRARPFYADSGAGQEVVVKFGDRGKIDQEYHNFRQYVEPFIGGGRSTTVRDEVRRTPRLGGIAYSLIGAVGDQVEDFGAFYRHATIAQIKDVLDRLFFHTCGSWYANPGRLQLYNLTEEYQRVLGFTRERLEQAVAEQLKTVQGKQKLQFRALQTDRSFTNPFLKLEQPLLRTTYACITHGDFNEQNILVDGTDHAWLIDFLRTGPGHILRDVALLDAVVRTQVLRHDEATLAERLEMEELLAGVNRFSQLDALFDRIPTANPAVAKACTISLHLRTIARRLVQQNPSDDLSEYHIASLYMMINMVRLYWLPTVQREHALITASLMADRLGL